MIARVLAAIGLVYLVGFLVFAIALPRPLGRLKTDAVIVLTGGPGRIARGLEIIDRGDAKQMFVSGVDPEVKPDEFAAQFDVPAQVMRCCVTLGFLAVDTRSNAGEAAQWLSENRFRSVRLVTTDWHMARASSEFAETLPDGIRVVEDAVHSSPSLQVLFLEYNKLIAATLSQGLPG